MLDWVVLRLGALMVFLRHWRATVWFFDVHGRLPAISPPDTFNDKLFWRKIVDRNPLFVTFNDKHAVRDWVKSRDPALQQTEVLWVGRDPEALPDALFDRPLMIKHSAASGFNIHYDGQQPERAEMMDQLKGWMGRTYGTRLSEWAYGQVVPVILVEEMLGFADGHAPDNINVHASNGKVLFASVYRGDKRGRREIGFFDAEGARLPMQMIEGADPMPQDWAPSATLFKAMKEAKSLSRDVDYVRCDFMATETEIWFNEMTTYTASGHLRFDNPTLVDHLAQGWDLRQSWFVQTPQTGLRELYRGALRRALDRRAERVQ